MAPRDLRTRLVGRASRAGLFLPADLVDSLVAYYELLAKWNRKINLTALDDPDAAVDRLLLEPVAAARHIPAMDIRLIDVGSGGGSPAIPLALAARVTALTMVEVKARKSAFLREAIRVLSLPCAVVETARFEELVWRPELHRTLDVLSIRAVRIEMPTLNVLQGFLRPGGRLLMFRGPGGPVEPPTGAGFRWVETVPLIDSLQSRLSVLEKSS